MESHEKDALKRASDKLEKEGFFVRPRDGQGITAFDSISVATAKALFATSVVVFCSAISFHHVQNRFFGPGVQVRLGAWNWVDQARLGFDQPEALKRGDAVTAELVADSSLLTSAEPAILPISKVLSKSKKKASLRSVSKPRIRLSKANLRIETAPILPVERPAQASAAVEADSRDEATKMLELHQALRNRFRLAMTTQSVNTHLAAEDVAGTLEMSSHELPQKPIKARSPARPSKKRSLTRNNTDQADRVLATSAKSVSESRPEDTQGRKPQANERVQITEVSAATNLAYVDFAKKAKQAAKDVGFTIAHEIDRGIAKSEEPSKAGPDYSPTASSNHLALGKEMPEKAPREATSKAMMATQKQMPFEAARAYHEGFDPQRTVLNAVTTQRLSYEVASLPNQSEAGWEVVSSQDHLNTVYRFLGTTTPVISRNTIWVLSKLAGAPYLPELGVIFGKVPSGWTIRFDGRSERPIFFNDRFETISPHLLEGERYFVLLNVAPGAHPVYLIQNDGRSAGAVGAPVLRDSATFLDLTWMSRQTIRGRVHQSDGLFETQVSILGNSEATAFTRGAGTFKMDNVLTIADYPLIIESESKRGYAHRYQVSPAKLSDLTLYQMSPSELDAWIAQLEGGVSPQGGVIVSALPGWMSRQRNPKVYPSTNNLVSAGNLVPETYSIDADGHLQVNQPLEISSPRMISVQVPEGPNAVALTDDSGRVLWSEIVVSSPNVVNVVGPY